MTKIKLLIVPEDATSFHASWIIAALSPTFDVIWATKPCDHNPRDSILVTNANTPIDTRPWHEQGFKILLDNLWEFEPAKSSEEGLVLESDLWFWINEHLWYKELGLDSYTRQPIGNYRALMPMGRRKQHRTLLLRKISKDLNQFIWSYTAMGRLLPNSQSAATIQEQREFRAEWWDQTQFSIVAESDWYTLKRTMPTEKSMRPLAFTHPFVVLGQVGTLAMMKSWGFETWPHLWDESYDSEESLELRTDKVIAASRQFNEWPHSQTTLSILEHNKNLFWSTTKVQTLLQQEVITPILTWANL